MSRGSQVDSTLIIRARDEASKAISAIEGALSDLLGTQQSLAKGSDSTASGIGKTVAALAALDRAYATVAGAQDRAADATARQLQTLASNQAQLGSLRKQLDNARAAQERMNAANRTFVGPPTAKAIEQYRAVGEEIRSLEARSRQLERTVDGQQAGFTRTASNLTELGRAQRLASAVTTFAAQAADEHTQALEREAAAVSRVATLQANIKRATDATTGKSAAESAGVFSRAGLTQFETEQRELGQRAAMLRAQIDPAAEVQRRLNRELAELPRLAKAGKFSLEELAGAENLLRKNADLAVQALQRQQGAGGRAGLFGLRPYELQNLSYQINDIATQLASGTSLAQALAQQGGQIVQIFPRAGSAMASAIKDPRLLAAAAAISAIAIGLGDLVAESGRLRDFGGTLEAMGDSGTASAEELNQVVEALDLYALSAKDALSATRTFLREGINPEYFEQFGRSAKDMADVLGIDVDQAAKQVAEAFNGGYDAIVKLDRVTNLYTASELKLIRQLFEEGKANEARTRAFAIFSQRMQDGADKARGPWTRAIDSLSNAWDRFKNVLGDSEFVRINALALEKLGDAAANALGRLNGDNSAPSTNSAANRIAALRGELASLRSDLGKLTKDGMPADAFGQRYVAALQRRIADLNARLTELAKSDDTKATGENSAEAKRRQDILTELGREEELARLREAAEEGLSRAQAARRKELAGILAYSQEIEASGDAQLAQEKLRLAVQKESASIDKQNKAARERAISQFNSRVIGAEGGSGSNPNSTATGYGQFLNGTWLEQFRKVFAEQASRLTESQILALRKNEQIAKAIIDNYARENAAFLEGFGAKVTAGNLYLAHFLGPRDAKRILTAAPDTPVDQILSRKVIEANRGYLAPQGKPRTAAGLIDFIAGRVGDTGSAQTAGQVEIAKLIEDSRRKQDEFNLSVEQANQGRQRNIDALRIEAGLQDEALLDAQRQATVDKAVLELRQRVEELNSNVKPGQEQIQLTEDQIAATRRLVEEEERLRQARDRAQASTDRIERPIRDLTAEREAVAAQILALRAVGESGAADALESRLDGINGKLVAAIDAAIAFNAALNPATDPLHRTQEQINAAIASLKTARIEAQNFGTDLQFAAVQIQDAFAGSLSDSVKQFSQDIATGENAFESFGRVALSFTASFVEKLADMGLEILAFRTAAKLGFGGLSDSLNGLFASRPNATSDAVGAIGETATATASSATLTAAAGSLTAAGGTITAAGGTLTAAGGTMTAAAGTLSAAAAQLLSAAISLITGSAAGGGGLLGSVAKTIAANPAIFHGGGIAGQAARTRAAAPSWFANAVRYHTGGVAGLRPNEVPAILERGEEVLTRADPRHRGNGGLRTSDSVSLVLGIGEDEITNAMKNAAGEKVILAMIRRNRETVRQMLGD